MSRNTTAPIPLKALSTASQPAKRTVGRPPSLVMPPLPQALLDGMQESERDHFDFFKSAYEQAFENKYGKLTPTASISIVQAALDYVHLMRMQAEQMATGTLITQARQHPGTSLRAWLQAAGLQEKDMIEPSKTVAEDDKAAMKAALLSISRDD